MTVGTAGLASRIFHYRPTHWWRLHNSTSLATTLIDSVVLNTASNVIVAYRGAISTQQTGPLHVSQYTYAMTFDGVADAIEFTQADSTILTGTTGTFFAFYKRSAAATAGTIIGGLGASNRELHIGILSTGAPYVTVQSSAGNAATTTATSNFSDDTSWHFLVITSDGSNKPNIYIDGVACTTTNSLSGTAVAGSWFSYVGGTTSMDIGRKGNTGVNDGTVYFKGSLSEIGYINGTVWSAADQLYVYQGASFFYAATSANFNDIIVESYWRPGVALANVNPALTNFATFDEASGNVVNNGYHGDTSSFWVPTAANYQQAGSGHDALNFGMGFTATAAADGIAIGSAGIGRYLIATGETYGAVLMIVKQASTATAAWLFMVKGDAGVGFSDYIGALTDGTDLRIQGVIAGGNSRIHQTATITSLFDNTYHFIAFVQRGDGTGVHIFIDGVEQSYIADVTAGVPPTVDMWSSHISYTGGTSTINKAVNGAGELVGTWDTLAIIANATLSDADITNLQAARSRTTSSSAAIPTLVRHQNRRAYPT